MPEVQTPERITAWAVSRVPTDWFVEPAAVASDDVEILIVGGLRAPGDATPETCADAIDRFRRETRAARVRISADGERRFRRRV
ncbi:MAG: hypothetical protein M3295_01400, partial [Chloroflexota bacterium]|nr:hypothetical protein [Chloroflexota bacterium]